jgi:hypothetical protein
MVILYSFRGFSIPGGGGEFLTALAPTQLPIQWVPGDISLGVKRSGREADYSHFHLVPRSKIPQIPQYTLMALCSVKEENMDNFAFYFCSVFFA